MNPSWRLVTVLLASLFSHGGAFLTDDLQPGANTPSSSFHLTSAPSPVTRGVTQNVTLSCRHDGKTQPLLTEVSRIRIMRQTDDGWTPLAQRTLANTTSIPDRNVHVTGTIRGDINATYLQVEWYLADHDTFGTFRCDVIGLDGNQDPASESSSEVQIVEQPVSKDQLLDLLLATREEMASLTREVSSRLAAMDRQISRAKSDALTKSEVAAWPGGRYALLQPASGCPADLTFMGGDRSFFTFHTESNPGVSKNGNSYTKALPLSTTTSLNGYILLLTMRFCEARRQFGSPYWPSGVYCINKIHGQPCPRSFKEGQITLDVEDNNTTSDLQGNVIREFGDRVNLGFCCRDGLEGREMTLPTASPFMLYRKGGACQKVRGMSVSEESITIDTEDTNNGDTISGDLPDIFTVNTASKPLRFMLCYYTKR